MMEKGSRLTNASMEHRNYFQCYYNNVGYCKFRGQCRYQHYTRICPRSVCKFRLPKTCKFGPECRFLTRKCCFFSHEGLESDDKVSQEKLEPEKLLKEILELKAEIEDLKRSVDFKEEQLNQKNGKEADFLRLIKDLEEENENMKTHAANTESENKNLKSLVSKLELTVLNQCFDIKADASDEQVDKTESPQITELFLAKECKICEKVFYREADLKVHGLYEHVFSCDFCSLRFESKLHLTAHFKAMHNCKEEDLKALKDKSNPLQCRVCLRNQESESIFANHTARHCVNCQNILPDNQALSDHRGTCNDKFFFWHFKNSQLTKMCLKNPN